MPYAFTPGDVEFLRSSAGVDALVEVDELALRPETLVRDLARMRGAFGEHAGALVETVRLRRRAKGRIDDAQRWLFTDEGLQQATASVVARHRAGRLAGRAVHDVTCSLGAELAALVPMCETVIGSDLDPVRLAMAAGNAPGAHLLRADALAPCTRDTAVIADPARRVGARRTRDPNRAVPPLPALLDVYRRRDLAVKCAPGLDFDRLDWDCEVEVVSLDGGVREACLWSPGLGDGVRRRASVLRSDGSVWSVTDTEPDELPDKAPGEWIIDPDGAVVRAGLVRNYGARHGLWQLDPSIAYLTGDAVPARVRGFRVLDRLRFDERILRRELARRDCGSLEIRVRGLDVDPDALRRRLKLRGTASLTLILTRIGCDATAFVCAEGALTSP